MSPDQSARLCHACSKLDVQRLTRPLYPCRAPFSECSAPPTGLSLGDYLVLGSIDEIKSRRLTCEICNIVAECLDKEPSDLNGECHISEAAHFCKFRLPANVKAQDPTITHFHLTEAMVTFNTSLAHQFQGPSLPWELKEKDKLSTHYILVFQAKAKSDVEQPTVPSPRTECELLNTVGGRCVAPQVNPQLIRAWLHKCESKHGENCMPFLRLPAEHDKDPAFVVDVVQSCLVDTPSQCRYVALSYVWGTAPVFRHLLENTEDLRRNGSLRTFPIPTTIRDSMTLVDTIGERYLWVDSLCIIQNDLRMQQAEILRMGSIYSKALFTIIAATGSHANSGLPGVEPGSREQVQRALKLSDSEILTVIDVRRSPSGIDNTIWAQRGWTFQERVLSNRVLVFSENQVYWSCRVVSYSEERALEEIRNIYQRHRSFPDRTFGDYLSWDPLQPLEYSSAYDDLLASYRQRQLTYQTDILNAFNGVSEILSAIQTDRFIWGLPESIFSYSITWYFVGNSTRNHVDVPIFKSDGSIEMIPFPSWSWAAWSVEEPDKRHLTAGQGSGRVQPVVQFSVVDNNYKLVEIKERPWEKDKRDRTWWKKEQPHRFDEPRIPLRIGQLRFWTSFANVRTIRRWRDIGPDYILSTSPYFESHLKPPFEIVQQDFIVVAASGSELVLLAIEWKDGVAYRVGRRDVNEKEWMDVENKEWRLITLG